MKRNETYGQKDFSIDPHTKIGSITLKVSDLESQVEFYKSVLGFQIHSKTRDEVGLGTAERALLFLEQRHSFKRYSRVTGLYHFAVLYPNQHELARAIGRLFKLNYPNSPTDHIMTKTTYLDDPEGNGIELYAESPEDGEWFMDETTFGARRKDGSLSSGREPLDLDALFSHLGDGDTLADPISPNTRIGHIHLHVSNIDDSLDFYSGILGFDVMGVSRRIGMAFVSAGGYHHHIGLNTWQGQGIPPAPQDALGLDNFSVELPDRDALEQVTARADAAGKSAMEQGGGLQVKDPNQIKLLLKVK